jgi:hypothetical protein
MLFLPFIAAFIATALLGSLYPVPWVSVPSDPFIRRIGSTFTATAVSSTLGELLDYVPKTLHPESGLRRYVSILGIRGYQPRRSLDGIIYDAHNCTWWLDKHIFVDQRILVDQQLLVDEPTFSPPLTFTRERQQSRLEYWPPLCAVAGGILAGILVVSFKTALHGAPSPVLVPDIKDCDLAYFPPVLVGNVTEYLTAIVVILSGSSLHSVYSLDEAYGRVRAEAPYLTTIAMLFGECSLADAYRRTEGESLDLLKTGFNREDQTLNRVFPTEYGEILIPPFILHVVTLHRRNHFFLASFVLRALDKHREWFRMMQDAKLPTKDVVGCLRLALVLRRPDNFLIDVLLRLWIDLAERYKKKQKLPRKKPHKNSRPCKKARERANRKRREGQEALSRQLREDTNHSTNQSTIPAPPPLQRLPIHHPRESANHVLVNQGFGEVWVPRGLASRHPIQPVLQLSNSDSKSTSLGRIG